MCQFNTSVQATNGTIEQGQIQYVQKDTPYSIPTTIFILFIVGIVKLNRK